MNELMPGADSGRACRLPATNVQERFLFVERAGGRENDATVTFAWRLRGPISESSVAEALRRIIERHEILRTRLVATETGIEQEVLAEAPFHLACLDLRAMPAKDRIERVHAIERDAAEEPMDPCRPGLFRATLVKTGTDEAVLLGVAHHCIFDGQSTAILARELAEILAAQAEGRAPELPTLRLQYGDFALWQRDLLESGALESSEAFWRERLAGAQLSALSPDRAEGDGDGRGFATLEHGLAADFGRRMEALARRLEVSRFALGLAITASVLAGIGGRDDLVIGTQASLRTSPLLAPLPGVFINTLPVRIALNGREPIAELARRTQTALSEALDHAGLPFDRILRAAGIAHPAGHSGPALVNFDFRDGFFDRIEVGPVAIEAFPSRLAERIHDLSISILGGPEGWRLGITYNGARFADTGVARMARALEARLSAVLDDPDAVLPERPQGRVAAPASPPDHQRMAALWASVLGRPAAGPDDNFFDLGGYSILLLRLAVAIEREFGVRVEVPALLAAPTLRGMVDAVRRAGAERETLAATSPKGWWQAEVLRRGHPGGPILLTVNQVFLFRRIAELMDDRVTVASLSIGVSPTVLAAEGAEIPDLARDAAALVRAHYQGRVLGLCGHCVDGLVAMHVAHELSDANLAVAAMVDTWAPEALAARSAAARLGHAWAERLGRWRHHLRRFREGQESWSDLASQVGPLGAAFRALGRLPPPEPEAERLRALNRHLAALSEGARSPEVTGEVAIVATGSHRRAAAGSLLGWRGKLPPGTPVIPVPGWHEQALMDTGAADIANLLARRLLARAEQPRARR